VSHIKIAQEFIRDLQVDSGDVAIVRAAISLARELGIEVIAEGVETSFQLELLAEAGCHYMQGFYFSHPLPAQSAGEILRQGRIAAAITAAPPTRQAAPAAIDRPSSANPAASRHD